MRMHTDRNRTLVLSPLWCTEKQEWRVLDEARRVYEAAFGPLAQGEQLQLWLDGRDVTHAHFLESYRLGQPRQSITLATAQAGPFSARKVGPSTALDLRDLAQHSSEKRRELLRTETAQFVMQRLSVGGAVGEANDTLRGRHAVPAGDAGRGRGDTERRCTGPRRAGASPADAAAECGGAAQYLSLRAAAGQPGVSSLQRVQSTGATARVPEIKHIYLASRWYRIQFKTRV